MSTIVLMVMDTKDASLAASAVFPESMQSYVLPAFSNAIWMQFIVWKSTMHKSGTQIRNPGLRPRTMLTKVVAPSLMDNTHEKIVVIEADEASRTSLVSILEGGGWEVAAFATPREGLDALQHAGADLLLLDIDSCAADMLNVQETLVTIRGSSLTAPVRVIVMVCPGADNRALGLDLGADDAVSRPWAAKELLARI